MKSILFAFLISLLLFGSSCATIIGGTNYYAHVKVKDHPNAKIIYKGRAMGTGNASIKAPRKEANKFIILIKEDGCSDQHFQYSTRSFRGWTLAGSIGLSLLTPIVVWPLAFMPIILDVATGSVWKPNKMEYGVKKINYENYAYELDYKGCDTKKEVIKSVGSESNYVIELDVVYLKNGSIIKGTITENIPNDHIKIQTADENIFVFEMEDIDKIEKVEVE